MDDRHLLLLGILMVHSQHGYQLHEFIERNLGRVTDMKKPTAYATLDRLSNAGYVDVHTEREGNRPVRKVYQITEAGQAYFMELLRVGLATADEMKFSSDIPIMFLDHLPASEAIALLQERLEQLEIQLEVDRSAPPHGFGIGVDLALEHHLAHLEADHQWIESVLERLRGLST